MTSDHDAPTVFISYAHKDADWLEELRPHLRALQRQRGIASWDDTSIRAGARWRDKLDQALRRARVAVVLVSKHLLDSDFVIDEELPVLLEAEARGNLVLLPVVLAPCRYQDFKALSRFQALNPPNKTLQDMPDVEREGQYVRLTRRIEEVLDAAAPPPVDVRARQPAEKSPKTRPAATRAKSALMVPPATPPLLRAPRIIADSWLRLSIQGDGDGRYRFHLIGISNDHVTHQVQPAMVEQLIHGMLNAMRYDRQAARTLAELLVPGELKPYLLSGRGCVVTLDPEVVRVPWELLLDPITLSDDSTAVLVGGIFRELALDTELPPRREAVSGPMLVVGAPQGRRSTYGTPGAAAEAHKIVAMYRAAGYPVTAQIEHDGVAMVTALSAGKHSGFHFAGDGLLDVDPAIIADPGTIEQAEQRRTGLSLSDGLMFTAAEVRQLRQVPEFVFLNAPYQGTFPGKLRSRVHGQPLPRGPGLQLCIQGTRVLVAPGWAVEDQAAFVFAETFYAALLSGRAAWSAISEARRATHRHAPHDITWAAYQYYGDPEYRLNPPSGEGLATR